MLTNGSGRPLDLARPGPTIVATGNGNRSPWVDTLGVVPCYHAHLVAGGAPRSGAVPGARRVSPGEAAALQGFDPGAVFCGSRSSMLSQIGNAVPPPLAPGLRRGPRRSPGGARPEPVSRFGRREAPAAPAVVRTPQGRPRPAPGGPRGAARGGGPAGRQLRLGHRRQGPRRGLRRHRRRNTTHLSRMPGAPPTPDQGHPRDNLATRHAGAPRHCAACGRGPRRALAFAVPAAQRPPVTHMPQSVRAILFPADPDEPVTAIDIDGSPAGIQTAVDGLTEVMTLGDAGAVLFVNAYGKSKRLPPNPRATRFVDGYVKGFARPPTWSRVRRSSSGRTRRPTHASTCRRPSPRRHSPADGGHPALCRFPVLDSSAARVSRTPAPRATQSRPRPASVLRRPRNAEAHRDRRERAQVGLRPIEQPRAAAARESTVLCSVVPSGEVLQVPAVLAVLGVAGRTIAPPARLVGRDRLLPPPPRLTEPAARPVPRQVVVTGPHGPGRLDERQERPAGTAHGWVGRGHDPPLGLVLWQERRVPAGSTGPRTGRGRGRPRSRARPDTAGRVRRPARGPQGASWGRPSAGGRRSRRTPGVPAGRGASAGPRGRRRDPPGGSAGSTGRPSPPDGRRRRSTGTRARMDRGRSRSPRTGPPPIPPAPPDGPRPAAG